MRILERTGSENHYLHKDFHGALCYAIKYLDEIYGQAVTTEFLKQVGKEQYGWLSNEIKKQGIMALVKGRLLEEKSSKIYPDYCLHCDVLYRRVLEPLGYEYHIDLSNSGDARCKLVVSESYIKSKAMYNQQE